VTTMGVGPWWHTTRKHGKCGSVVGDTIVADGVPTSCGEISRIDQVKEWIGQTRGSRYVWRKHEITKPAVKFTNLTKYQDIAEHNE
jgi:hypothetical protein